MQTPKKFGSFGTSQNTLPNGTLLVKIGIAQKPPTTSVQVVNYAIVWKQRTVALVLILKVFIMKLFPKEKIRYVLDDGRTVTTTFEALNKKTKVHTSFDADTENSLEMQRTGWQAILDNFKRYVESN